MFKKVIVKKSAEEKLKYFFPWVYENEILKYPKNVEAGDLVDVYSKNGKFLGRGYINPKSKITVRILTFKKEPINREFFKKQIERAIDKRKIFKNITNAYRVIHSEADFLSGLIVDKYDDYLTVQINTAGMERFRNDILEILVETLSPKGIYEKSDVKAREKEGLETEEKVLYGQIPDKIEIEEYQIKFIVYLKESQKTGFYLDQRKNRKIVGSYAKGNVLDLFSNAGGFGIHAYKNGAEFVKFVDISPNAIKQLEENVKLNGIENYEIVKEDVFDFLKKELKTGIKYDLIILDPPAFAKTKREREGALRGFKYLILNSLKILKENGLLAVFSCSHSITMEDLKKVSLEASKDTGFRLEILEHLYQDLDHPYILNIPNSLYLKGFLMRKID